MTYHGILIQCQKCHTKGTILNFHIRADGNVLLECLCVLCGIEFEWEAPMARLIIASNKADEESPKTFDFASMPTAGRSC